MPRVLPRGIRTIGPGGKGLRRITQGYDFSPSWSPSSRRIVFKRGISLYTVSRHGGPVTRVTPPGSEYGAPDWSPNGLKIGAVGGPGIYTMNPDGTDLTQILLTNEPDPDLSWRPRCNIRGTRGGDTLSGTIARELICGYDGNDIVYDSRANDAVFAGEGNDRVYGGRGEGRARRRGRKRPAGRRPGKGFPERARRIPGNDVLLGGADDDVCIADPGDIAIGC
jgi:hypothetical protein